MKKFYNVGALSLGHFIRYESGTYAIVIFRMKSGSDETTLLYKPLRYICKYSTYTG